MLLLVALVTWAFLMVVWAVLLWRRYVRRPAHWNFDDYMACGFQFALLSIFIASTLFGIGHATEEPAVRTVCYLVAAAVAGTWVVLQFGRKA